MPLTDKQHTLGDEAIEQLRAAVRYIEQKVDRLSAEPTRPGRQVVPLPKFGEVVANVLPGQMGELNLTDDDDEVTDVKIQVKNRYRAQTVLAGTRCWAHWWAGRWTYNVWECETEE